MNYRNKYIVSNIRVSLKPEDRSHYEELIKKASVKLKIDPKNIIEFKIAKQSIDARKKNFIVFVYSVVVTLDEELKRELPDVKKIIEEDKEDLKCGNIALNVRPIVIGTGPAGLFAAMKLAKYGFKPIVLERGDQVEIRTNKVNRYWYEGSLDTESNVQFGEGGAGTFSDGKLTTRINDRRCSEILEEFFRHGAPEEIMYKSKPHIGTDILKKVVVNIRNTIIGLGGQVLFNSKVTDFIADNNSIKKVVVNDNEKIDTQVVVLAIGHSARDTFERLYYRGVEFIQKPFSIGLRIEHPQELINRAQYGDSAVHPMLGAADYQLFYKTRGRTVYSFCMCPGGIVVASASESESIVTNGMSEFARNNENANSAMVVSVEPGDFGSSHPLAGIEFQRKWEKLAYISGGNSGAAPIQKVEDFMKSSASKRLGSVKPSYTGKTILTDLNTCLPKYVTDSIKEAIPYFDKKLKGFNTGDAILTGVETRTSSPVRIPRGQDLQSISCSGIYPCGEGAGYAGGIVSAAVDGLRIAEKIISTYKPNF